MILKYFIQVFVIINIVYCQNVRVSNRYQTRPELLQENSGSIISVTNGEANGASATSFGEVEGIAGVDYPAYTKIPRTSFKCRDMPYNPGMYADLETNCQAYHMCFQGRKNSFLCGIGTVFSQQILACDYWYSVDCSDTPNHYYVNEDLGKTKYESTSQLRAPVSPPLRSPTHWANDQSDGVKNLKIADTSSDNYGSYWSSETEPPLRRQMSHSTQIKPVVRQTQRTRNRETQRWRRPLPRRTDANISPFVESRTNGEHSPSVTQQKHPQSQNILNEEITEQNTPNQESDYDEQPLQEEIVEQIQYTEDNRNNMPHRTARVRPNYRQSVSYPSYEQTGVNNRRTQSITRPQPVMPDRQVSISQQIVPNTRTSVLTRQTISRSKPTETRVRPQVSHSQSRPFYRQTLNKSQPVVTRHESLSSPEIPEDSSMPEDFRITNQHIRRNKSTHRSTPNVLRPNTATQLRPNRTRLLTPDTRYQEDVRLAEQTPTEQPDLIYTNDNDCCTELDYALEEPQHEENVDSDESKNRTRLLSRPSRFRPPVKTNRPQYSQSVPIYSTQRVTQQPTQSTNRPLRRPQSVITRNNRPNQPQHPSLALPIENVRQTSPQILKKSRPIVTGYTSDSSPDLSEESYYENQSVAVPSPNRSIQQINRIQSSNLSTNNVLRVNTATQSRPRKTQLLTSGRTYQTDFEVTTEQPNILNSDDYVSNPQLDYVAENPQQEEFAHSREPQNSTRLQEVRPSLAKLKPQVQTRPQYSNRRVDHRPQHSNIRQQSQLVTSDNIRPNQPQQHSLELPIENVRQTSRQIIRSNRPSLTKYQTLNSTEITEHTVSDESSKPEQTQSIRDGNQLIHRRTQLIKNNSGVTNQGIVQSIPDNHSTKFVDQFEYSDDYKSDYAIEDNSKPSEASQEDYHLVEQPSVRTQPTTRLLSNRRQQQTYSRRVLQSPQSSSTLYSDSRPIHKMRKLVTSSDISDDSANINQNEKISRRLPISNRQQISRETANKRLSIASNQQTQAGLSEQSSDYETMVEDQPDLSNSEVPITQIGSK